MTLKILQLQGSGLGQCISRNQPLDQEVQEIDPNTPGGKFNLREAQEGSFVVHYNI